MSTIKPPHRVPSAGRAPAVVVCELSKNFGPVPALVDVSFDVWPGTIVSVVGPRRSGKSTVLRALLGQIEPTSGIALFGTRRYRDLLQPRRVVGSVLDCDTSDRDRTVRAHLTAMALRFDLPTSRIEAVLEVVGLAEVAEPRLTDVSRGVRQRVAIAGALLGDPQVLVLDEPSTGLDRETLRWLRCILRDFADAGNSVLVTANSVSEMERAADELVIIKEGRMITQASVVELLAGAARTASLHVRTPHAGSLARALASSGRACVHLGYDTLRVHDITSDELGRLAAADGIEIIELLPEHQGLEQVVASFVERPLEVVTDIAESRRRNKRSSGTEGMMGPVEGKQFDMPAFVESSDPSEWT